MKKHNGEKIQEKEIKGELVSIIIPTYNREKTLERAILSVMNQTYKEWELIIIDDGSSDGTKELVSKYVSPKVHYIKLEMNQGVCKSRNIGIKYAKGGYVAFLDSDDEWVADKLEKQMKELEQKGTKVAYCRFSRNYGNDKVTITPNFDYNGNLEGDIFYELLLGNFIGAPTMIIAKDILEEVGGFNENLMNLEDYELILRIAKDFYIAFTNEVLVHTYAQNDSININLYHGFFARKYLLELYREEYERMGVYEIVLKRVLEIGELAQKMKEIDFTKNIKDLNNK